MTNTQMKDIQKSIRSVAAFVRKSVYPARAWPVTRELKTASVIGRSLLFIKPRIVL